MSDEIVFEFSSSMKLSPQGAEEGPSGRQLIMDLEHLGNHSDLDGSTKHHNRELGGAIKPERGAPQG
jgi:hypothetical protein